MATLSQNIPPSGSPIIVPWSRSRGIAKVLDCSFEVIDFELQLCNDIRVRINTLGKGGSRGVVVIVLGNGHGDTSSNPGRDWLHFT